ncbi:S13A3 protein, partial [Polypterus senegalus]
MPEEHCHLSYRVYVQLVLDEQKQRASCNLPLDWERERNHLSGLVMASAIEEWNLHRRIALKVLMIVGVKPAWLILGIMLTTAFLSMWLSNTATTAMMLPIASAILKSLFGDLETLKEKCKRTETNTHIVPMKLHSLPTEAQFLNLEERVDFQEMPDTQSSLEIRQEAEYQKNVWKGFLIAIPYSASIGGTATLTGTSPNLILVGQLSSVCFKKKNVRMEAEERARAVIKEDYEKLGPVKFAEGAIGVFFVLFALLLFTRDPKFFPGWAKLFKSGSLHILSQWEYTSRKEKNKYLTRSHMGTTSIVILHKSKFSLSPCNLIVPVNQESGLSLWIGSRLQPLESVPPGVAVLLITLVIASFTEFASNTATIIIFLPVLAELAVRLKVNPLYLMIPGTVGCSYAFMLPVSTPPNSIAFASGHLTVKDMVRTGIVMNIIGVLLLSLAMNTWAQFIFDLSTFPTWAITTTPNVSALELNVSNSARVTFNVSGYQRGRRRSRWVWSCSLGLCQPSLRSLQLLGGSGLRLLQGLELGVHPLQHGVQVLSFGHLYGSSILPATPL